MQRIKRDDEVIVLAGKDKGKRGTVRRVLDNDRLLVSGVNMIKKHTKPDPQAGVQGGIVEREASIQISNVGIFNPSTGKADRVGIRVEDGKKARIYKSSGEVFDAK
jgi:large subunit ribosomal protein L24